jgi:hypothetical protein
MAKVNQLNDIVSFGILEQDVLWLDVSVTNAQIVQVVEATKDLSQEHGGVSLRKLALPLHLVEEVAALSQRLNQVEATIILKVLIQLNCVRVILTLMLWFAKNLRVSEEFLVH